MKLTLIAVLLVLLLSACAPSVAAPAPTAMLNPAPTTGAMMSSAASSSASMMQPTESSGAMMEPTPTAGAMLQAAPTIGGMMPQATATAEAMMAPASPTAEAMLPSDRMMSNAPAETKAAHLVSMSPKHGQLLDKSPDQITIAFDTPLAPTSMITLAKDGKDIAVGKMTLGDKNLSMSVTLPSASGDGVYLVKYVACQSDQMCSNGQFAFQVDSMMHQ